MAVSKGLSKSKGKGLARFFPTLADVVTDTRNAARLETLEILMDVEQVSSLFSSFDEVRQGQIVGMENAFGDL